jgi:hypothetical protein
MKYGFAMLISACTLSGCCGLGGVSERTVTTYSAKSTRYPDMTLTDAQNKCGVETDGALNIWRNQCDNPTLNLEQIKESAPPIAKRMTYPILDSMLKWDCKEIKNIQHYQLDTDQNMDSSLKIQLNNIQSTCIKELGFKEYNHTESSCRPSFFGPY